MTTRDHSIEAAARRMKSVPAGAWLAPLLGALAGLGYFYLIGCRTGGCILGAQWWSSMGYGALLGLLVHATFSR